MANTSFLTGLTNAYVQGGGGTIDNGGFNAPSASRCSAARALTAA